MAQKTSESLSPRGRFWDEHVQQWQRSGATQVLEKSIRKGARRGEFSRGKKRRKRGHRN